VPLWHTKRTTGNAEHAECLSFLKNFCEFCEFRVVRRDYSAVVARGVRGIATGSGSGVKSSPGLMN
jgi:hypothetical protein